MSMYKLVKSTFIQEYKTRPEPYKQRLVEWSAQAPVVNAGKPTNIARARELGYKAKEGIFIARVRVKGGSKKRQAPSGGRKPHTSGRFFTRAKSLQAIAEGRAAARFSNCEVLNSYFVGSAGSSKFFEVIMLDRSSPTLAHDPKYGSIIASRNRALRGLTHVGRKHRGISKKGFGYIQFRPSRRQQIRGR